MPTAGTWRAFWSAPWPFEAPGGPEHTMAPTDRLSATAADHLTVVASFLSDEWRATARQVCRRLRAAVPPPRAHPLNGCEFVTTLEALQWARGQGCPWSRGICTAAIACGRLDVLLWARAAGCPWDSGSVCHTAAGSGHLELLRWAYDQGCAWDVWTCAAAAGGGHLAVLQWARARLPMG
jgi:hypothetical protein